MQGILTRFDENSGVGRITSDDGMQLLMHKTSIDSNPSPLKLGQTVEFRIYYGPNGPIAENVHRLRL